VRPCQVGHGNHYTHVERAGRKGQKIIQAMFDNVSHNLGINTLIAMHDDVAEADHLAHGVRQGRRQPVVPLQQVKRKRSRGKLIENQ
jgi:hypothetical protein